MGPFPLLPVSCILFVRFQNILFNDLTLHWRPFFLVQWTFYAPSWQPSWDFTLNNGQPFQVLSPISWILGWAAFIRRHLILFSAKQFFSRLPSFPLDWITFVPALGIATGSSAFFTPSYLLLCSTFLASLCLPARSAGIGSSRIGFLAHFLLLLASGFPSRNYFFSFTVRRELACGLSSLFREVIADIPTCPI